MAVLKYIMVVGRTIANEGYVYGQDSSGYWGRRIKDQPQLPFVWILEKDVPDAVHHDICTIKRTAA